FVSKEDFAAQAVELYAAAIHAQLDAVLADASRPPLARVRTFFELAAQKYAAEGYLGCFLGALGQELSGTSELFRHKIEGCLASIVDRIAGCLEEARAEGALAPSTDPRQLAEVLVNCWEGAALRTRLRRSPDPLHAVLDFYFHAAAPAPPAASAARLIGSP
ncbi:MAG TPA: TetR family transcriptional regulator C-terminal domain-containing protein, partial [Gemmatimonadaceae bacterium]|nr:TetR family transcriptional regulator C-terminal domain-containing protein [Gemmatimonadaceae bacterium]